jgi:hypothetical protein
MSLLLVVICKGAAGQRKQASYDQLPLARRNAAPKGLGNLRKPCCGSKKIDGKKAVACSCTCGLETDRMHFVLYGTQNTTLKQLFGNHAYDP